MLSFCVKTSLVLRLVKISDMNRQSSEHSNARLAVGPGGATIETSPNMWPSSGLKVDSAPTDVIWGRGGLNSMPFAWDCETKLLL